MYPQCAFSAARLGWEPALNAGIRGGFDLAQRRIYLAPGADPLVICRNLPLNANRSITKVMGPTPNWELPMSTGNSILRSENGRFMIAF